VLAAVGNAPGSTAASVARATGLPASTVGATLSRLVKQKRVRRLEEGGYAPLQAPSDTVATGGQERRAEPPLAPGAQAPSGATTSEAEAESATSTGEVPSAEAPGAPDATSGSEQAAGAVEEVPAVDTPATTGTPPAQ
jgi:hypothetical protein